MYIDETAAEGNNATAGIEEEIAEEAVHTPSEEIAEEAQDAPPEPVVEVISPSVLDSLSLWSFRWYFCLLGQRICF